MAERRFWLNVPRGVLWGVLAVAVLYFVWLLLIAGRVVVIRRGTNFIDPVVWVWVGVGVFALTLLFGVLALLPGRGGPAPSPYEAEAIPAAETRYAPPPMEAPAAAPRARGDVEIRVPPEDWKGKRVVELSIPPKSTHKGGVYAKAYIPVDETFVLRVEDLVADRRDISA